MARWTRNSRKARRILAVISSLAVTILIILLIRPEALTRAVGISPVTLEQLRQVAESCGRWI